MKTQKIKYLFIGVVFGIALSTSSITLANSDVVAKFISFNLLINGEPKILNEKPIVIDGTSYLPVREMANLVGYDVKYDAKTRTIKMDNQLNNDNSKTKEDDMLTARYLSEHHGVNFIISPSSYSEKLKIQKDNIEIILNQEEYESLSSDHIEKIVNGVKIIIKMNNGILMLSDNILNLI